jgi:hypothetical protein
MTDRLIADAELEVCKLVLLYVSGAKTWIGTLAWNEGGTKEAARVLLHPSQPIARRQDSIKATQDD